MANPKDLPRDIGGFIRDLRRNAKISLRQLAEQAGVSNPYLSQIERGLRKPSAEVLQQLASALRVSTPVMYLRAGLLDDKDGQGVLAAVAADDNLTMAQKQALSQIYETFRRENVRLAEATDGLADGTAGEPVESDDPGKDSAVADIGGDPPVTESGEDVAAVPAEPVAPPRPVVPPNPTPPSAPAVPAEAEAVAAAAVEAVAVAEAGATPAPGTTTRATQVAGKSAAREAAKKITSPVEKEKS